MEALLKLLVVTVSAFYARGAFDIDLVKNLPGLPTDAPFGIHSGFLDGFYDGHKLHYVFVESQNNPTKDPVVLWLNGGPGCSSMEGLLSENGPYWVQVDGETLKENPFSWNKIANVLYIDSPVGVGFSYIMNSTDYSTDDLRTTNDTYGALLSFFKKYPELEANDLYLTGESYGGIYIPLLSKKVHAKAALNLKGFLIVNGLLDYNTNYASMVFYLRYHGLLSERVFNNFTRRCCNETQNMKHCNVYQPVECREMLNVDVGPINLYNIYTKCALQQTFKIGNESLASALPCVDSSYLEKYMNSDKVKSALNIRSCGDRKAWRICSLDLNNNQYKRTYQSTEGVIRELVNNNVRGYIINGDVDSVCNFLGNEWSFDNLNLKLTEGRHYYTVNGQVGGFTKASGNIRLATVKGAGHMIPQDKPEIALRLFDRFLANQDLSEKKP